jgi:hypothetical protein
MFFTKLIHLKEKWYVENENLDGYVACSRGGRVGVCDH